MTEGGAVCHLKWRGLIGIYVEKSNKLVFFFYCICEAINVMLY